MVDQTEKHIVSDSDEISLKEVILKIRAWWLFLLSKWLVILCAGIIGGLIGLAYAWTKKPIYKAELSFALQDEKAGGGIGGALGLASQFGIDFGNGGSGGEFSGENLLALMESRSIVEKTLLTTVDIRGRKQTLAQFYIDFNQLRGKWKHNPELSNIDFLPNEDRDKFSLKQDSILGVFYKNLVSGNLTVDKLDKKLSIISLTVKSTNELFSKVFAEVLAKVVSDFYVSTKTEKQKGNVAILQRQSDSVRRILYGGISGVAESADINPNPNPTLQVLRVPSQRKQIEVQANSAILIELVRNLEAAKMSLLQETPLIQVIDRPILPLDQERFGKSKGLTIGIVIAVLSTVIFLSLKMFFRNLLHINDTKK